jgi:hypothetical protein
MVTGDGDTRPSSIQWLSHLLPTSSALIRSLKDSFPEIFWDLRVYSSSMHVFHASSTSLKNQVESISYTTYKTKYDIKNLKLLYLYLF